MATKNLIDFGSFSLFIETAFEFGISYHFDVLNIHFGPFTLCLYHGY